MLKRALAVDLPEQRPFKQKSGRKCLKGLQSHISQIYPNLVILRYFAKMTSPILECLIQTRRTSHCSKYLHVVQCSSLVSLPVFHACCVCCITQNDPHDRENKKYSTNPRICERNQPELLKSPLHSLQMIRTLHLRLRHGIVHHLVLRSMMTWGKIITGFSSHILYLNGEHNL